MFLLKRSMKAALVTPILSHLPFHPSPFLGYGGALLKNDCSLDVIDLNANVHLTNLSKLRSVLDIIDKVPVVSDDWFLYLFYNEIHSQIDQTYRAVPWKKYQRVYVTTPSWFPTVPTDAVLRLHRCIMEEAPETGVCFFGNSLGSWTDEKNLTRNGMRVVHLNGLSPAKVGEPVDYDSLPVPLYVEREKYLFDLLPFMLKHGCPWGKCRFCSLSKGANSGYLERSAKAAFQEIESLLEKYRPRMLVCRDNAINGKNLREFCSLMADAGIPWIAMARADLSEPEIRLLRNSGCKLIYFGLESGSDKVLRSIRKGIGTAQLSHFLNCVYDQEIIAVPSLIVGTPAEGESEFKETIRFLGDHSRLIDMVNVYPFMLTPGSGFYCTGQGESRSTMARLNEITMKCQDLGIRVCIGEQSAEYLSFRKVHPDHVVGRVTSRGPLSSHPYGQARTRQR
jgi:radical SAM superfamily enzyme YgiQ (UPF0313 family)